MCEPILNEKVTCEKCNKMWDIDDCEVYGNEGVESIEYPCCGERISL